MKAIQDLICKYREYAVAHGAAICSGEYKAANKYHDKLTSLLPLIREAGDDAAVALAQLVNDRDDAVVCWSATHLLSANEAVAIPALNRLVKKSGPMAFNAKMVLKQWEKGELAKESVL